MEFETSVADSRKYLVCRVTSPITLDVAHRMAKAMNDLANETGIDGRLIDVRAATNVMSVINNYDLAYKDLDDFKIDRSVKVASLCNPDDSSQEFVHNAIRNAGFNLRVFTEEAPAVAWLEED